MEYDPWSNRDVTTAVVAVVDLLDTEGRPCTTHVYHSERRSETRTVRVQP